MNDVRARLSRLISEGMQGRTIPTLYQGLRLYFQAHNEALSWQTFLEWCGGLRFPATYKRQCLLADKIGGPSGDAIKMLKAPPFRGKRRKIMEEHDLSIKHRDFPVVMRVYGEREIPHAQIMCSICDRTYHHLRRGSVDTPDYFRKHGWRVGHSASGDVCPKCIDENRHRKVVVKMEDHRKPETAAAPVANGAGLPDGMTKEDARLLIRFIEDHWDANEQHYASGWSDLKMAEEMGKSIEWVRFIRERDFGGAGEDPDVQEFVTKALKLENEMEDLGRRMEEWTGSTTASMLETIKNQMVDVGAAVNKDIRLRAEYQDKHTKLKHEVRQLIKMAENAKLPFVHDKKASG